MRKGRIVSVVLLVTFVFGGLVIDSTQVDAKQDVLITKSFPVYSGGLTEKNSSVWSEAFSALVSQAAYNSGVGGFYRVTGEKWFGNYYIQRSHLIFDTSLIPANAVIESAKLVFWSGGNLTSSSTGLYIVSSNQSDNYVSISTYSQVGGVDLGHLMYSSEGEHEIALNVDGIDAIGKATLTKLALRSWHDFNNIEPLQEIGAGFDGDDHYIVSPEGQVSLAPKLIVTYLISEKGKVGKNCDKDFKNGKDKSNNGRNCREN